MENKVFYSDLDKFKSGADPLRQSAYDHIVKFVQVIALSRGIRSRGVMSRGVMSRGITLLFEEATTTL